jgi:hypothetical protein
LERELRERVINLKMMFSGGFGVESVRLDIEFPEEDDLQHFLGKAEKMAVN